ncbi:hypothetical protein pdam_00005311 [Pocillopora damicornis]|uniref:Uncharacterized protein n=1 Tax=Pocillopora damicornis TaxID=46731 RepID=A0A3M6U310_POCDA|nr:hypothetical protein pdam_00005311 [Pocillopora damicornis]
MAVKVRGRCHYFVNGKFSEYMCLMMLEKMMTAVALLVVLVTMFATFSRAEEKCAGGHINQNLCQKTCNFNKCTCDMVDTTSFSSCSQKCHILSSCPAMDCSGNQTLFS